MKSWTLAVCTVLLGSVAVGQSYLFGTTPSDGFGNYAIHHSPRYHAQALDLISKGYRPLTTDYGADQPTALRILIKDDSIASPLTQAYVDTLSREKRSLMQIYGLSDRDYDRLAAIAFGILGRETKFGTSFKYKVKEDTRHMKLYVYPYGSDVVPPAVDASAVEVDLPPAVDVAKLASRAIHNVRLAIWNLDPRRYLMSSDAWTLPDDSRGLTQIKSLPGSIVHYYCANVDELNDPKITAIATVGFLADSLRVLRAHVRNSGLTYVNEKNLFDYVLYIYFGSISKLTNPQGATPERNIYVQTVRQYMHALAMFENPSVAMPLKSDSACRDRGDS